MAQNASRLMGTQSVSVGSTSPASTSTFSQQIFSIRLAANAPVRFVVGDTVLTSSSSVLQQGALLPADRPEIVACSPGQAIYAVSTISNAVLTVSELSG